jgi:flagellar protein FlgJ
VLLPLAAQSGAKVQGAGDARAKDMAKEFEATLLSMLLKEMRQTLDPEEGGLFPGDSGDVQGGLFDLYLGRHLADSGGVGLAATLVRQMTPTDAPAQAVQPPNDAPATPDARLTRNRIPPAAGK